MNIYYMLLLNNIYLIPWQWIDFIYKPILAAEEIGSAYNLQHCLHFDYFDWLLHLASSMMMIASKKRSCIYTILYVTLLPSIKFLSYTHEDTIYIRLSLALCWLCCCSSGWYHGGLTWWCIFCFKGWHAMWVACFT